MVNLYAEYSSGYFDLVISDECHRSIYGQWSGVLRHFDGVQVGLTTAPCVADRDSGGDDEDKAFVRDTLRFFEVDAPTFSYKLKTAIRDGYLVPYQIYKAQTVKTAAAGGFEVRKPPACEPGLAPDAAARHRAARPGAAGGARRGWWGSMRRRWNEVAEGRVALVCAAATAYAEA